MTIFAMAVIILLFLLWAPRDTTAWICLGATLLGCLWSMVVIFYPRAGQGETYSYTLPQTVSVYLLLTILAGILLMALHAGVTVAITVQALLLLAFAIIFGINTGANRASAAERTAQAEARADLRDAAFEVKELAADATDPAARKALGHLYDTIACSPLRTGRIDPAMTAAINSGLDTLAGAVATADTTRIIESARALERLYARRNR